MRNRGLNRQISAVKEGEGVARPIDVKLRKIEVNKVGKY